ncbi:MAG TPA: hypothetical protein IAC90_06310 [Candidatus Coproplasma stercorigallinarum]|nr:hypothetical protein [Candidatus Coproplasma stercorigallinarum]
MQTRNKKRITGIIALALIFVIAVTAALYFAAFFSPATHSADYVTATVSGDISGGVDVYISGDGVTRDEDGAYSIPSGTDVEITVINNTAVSSELKVNGTTSASPNFYETTVGNSNISIEVNGSLATEEGTSLFTAYELSDSTDFLALSKILAAVSGDVTAETLPTIVSYLAEFGFDDESWYTTGESGNTILNSANATVGNVQTALNNAKTALSTAYFRLTGDVMLNEAQTGATTITTGYFGLGSRRGEAFRGVLDFDGYSVTLNMDIPSVIAENFTSSTAGSATHNILSAGLFNYIYGDGTHACAILGADVRGTISLTTNLSNNSDPTDFTDSADYRIYIGGVAGSIGKNVVLDGISSSVSVSVQSSTDSGNSPISVYAGGVFGFSGADIDYWSDVSYTGNYSEISVTSSSGSANLPARTVVGALAGVIQNAYVNNFTTTLRGANILADSTLNGNAVAGGLAGIIFASSNAYAETNVLSSSLHIRGININASGATVSALTASTSNRTIDPDSVFVVNSDNGTMTSADAAIAGGLIGRVYGTNVAASNFTLYISEIDFGAVSGSEEFTIRSGTSNANSRAMTFAGGVVGYVSSGENFIDVSYNPGGEASTGAEGDAVIFSGNVVVNSVQNGFGPAYAGGIFGYNAFELPISTTAYTFNLTSESASLEVTAEQTAETANAGTLYDVCAGLYTSVLPDAYSINNLTFNANNATATARRLAGSTAVGDIAAGAIAGKANGNGGGNNSAVIQNLTVELNTCSINAFGYSFDSKYTTGQGNNVYAGGVIGYVRNYGDYDNNNQNNNIGLNNIKIAFDRSLDNSDYAVYGIQNAEVPSNSSDYWSEGYVGGMFGMMESGYATNLTVDGTVKDRTVIYFNSTNDPNTASVGGLIGATRNLQNNGTDSRYDSYAVKNSSVTDIHVAGRAYSGTQDVGWRWDIYVGGAIGVFGTANKNSAGTGLEGSNFASGITVEDCAIEAIGDEAMLTYAGGVFGGAWWVSSATVSDCVSRDNSVLASSATFNTFAGGIAGMIQNANSSITDSLVLNTNVEAITYSEDTTVANSNVKAYAAGICARVYQGSALKNSISNATVSASAPQLGDSYTVIAGIGILNDGGYSWLDDNNSIRGGGPSDYYFSSTDTYINNYFIAANFNKDIINLSAFMGIEGQDIYQYGERNWYRAGYNVENVQSLSNYAIALKGSGHGHITMPSDGEPLEHTMSVNGTFNVYNGLGLSSNSGPIAGRQYQVRVVGNGDNTLNGLTFTPNAQGTYYAQILIGGELLCSYPIIVGNASTSEGVTITTPDFTISSGDGTTTNAYVSSQNSHNYWSDAFSNSTQVDFSKLKANNFGTGTVQNVGGSIFTVIGRNSNDEIGTEHDNADITHLYFENQTPDNADTTSKLTGAISFEATSTGTLVIDAITNNSDNAIHPILYKVDGDTITHTEYTDLASAARKSFSIKIDSAGTYYVGFRGNGCRIYSINMQYEGDGAHSANSGTTYFQIYAGDMSYVQNVIVSNSNVYMPEIYLVTNSDYLLGYADGDENNNIHTADEIRGKATQITQNLGNATSITGVMGYFNVSTTDDGLGLNISPVLGNTTGAALVLRYTTGQDGDGNNIYYYVIIEVVPNAIVGLSIAPADDTPPRATTTDTSGEKIYIYAAGSDDRPETVRLEAEVEYRFPYNRFIVDVEFTKDSSTTATNSEVQPNGTIIVKGTSGQKVVVNCSPISDGSAIGNMSATLTIRISNSITVVADDMSGTSYAPVSDNDAVAGYPFSFTLDPNPGYGLNPELTIELQRENGNDYTNIMSFGITLPQKRRDGEVGEITYVYNGITYSVTETAELDAQTGIYTYSVNLDNIGISSFVLTYQYNVSTGVYTITLPDVMFVSTLNGYTLSRVRISASFQKVYSIMFDLGEWADDGRDNGGINSRYFIYQVKNGTAINSDLYNSITGELGSLFGKTQERAGFTFKGFYTTTSANTLASYGDSFTEMFKNGDGNSVIRGSMNFYARWNYTVALHAPSGIGIESGLSSSLLEENLKDGTDNSIIPIDIQHGFSFEITGTYAGTPRVEVYTVGADGALVPLAFTNVNGVYTVNNPEEITGTIHIYIYADNLTLAVSDTMDATQTSIDLRKDGIFTARYTVNYGSGVNAANGHAKEIIFSFANSADGTALSLPAGTRLRLFYHANGSAVAVGYYEVGSGGITSVAATAFRPLTGSDSNGSDDSATIFAFEGTLTSESLYLVVTLPNNDYTTFSGISSLNITVNAYSTTLTTTNYETAGVTYGNSESGDGTESGGEAENDSKVQNATDPENTSIQATVNLFNIVHRYGNPSGTTLTFKAENTSTAEGAPEDVRHADKYYVWRIAASNWDENMVANGATLVITDGYIYIAASTALALNNFSGTIELMEVTNTQYPAAGAVVWTYTSEN